MTHVTGQSVRRYRTADKSDEPQAGISDRAEDSRLRDTTLLKFLALHSDAHKPVRNHFLQIREVTPVPNTADISTFHDLEQREGRVEQVFIVPEDIAASYPWWGGG